MAFQPIKANQQNKAGKSEKDKVLAISRVIHPLLVLDNMTMKNGAPLCFLFVALLSVSASVAVVVNSEENGGRGGRGIFTAIYSFGDSFTDTGNALIAQPWNNVGKFPYGETYFHKPTGRFSDGRLLIDFFAKAWRMAFVDPYLKKYKEYESGVNFAVGGATALPASYFNERNLFIDTKLSLDVQVDDWFMAYKSKFCAKTWDCSQHFMQALFLVGEIGFNDYRAQLGAPEPVPLNEVERSIVDVVAAVEKALTKLIEQGSTQVIVVPNIFPLGCWPIYLQKYPQEPRDSMGCMPRFNRFAQTANEYQHKMIQKLKAKKLRPGVLITDIDYYGASLEVLKNPHKFGINETLVPCYHDSDPSSLCQDPSRYFSWDGIHLTDAAYNAIASLLLRTKPALFSLLKMPSAMPMP